MGQLRHSLERRLVLWTVALVVVPTFVCGIWLNQIARQAFTHNQVQAVQILTQTVATSLAGQFANHPLAGSQSVIDALSLDPRVAMVIISDSHEKIIHRQIMEPESYALFAAQINDADTSEMEIGRPIHLASDNSLTVHKLPIWNPPLRDAQTAEDLRSTDRQLEGFVVIALHDHAMAGFLNALRIAQIGATCVVCLLMTPLVVIAVRRWVQPIRNLLHATTQLADGHRPIPVPNTTGDELGQLADGFNAMAEKLYDAKLELERANQQLEDKVLRRTAELQESAEKLQREIDDKNEFLRAVSHDLGAPLRNINGMATMLIMKYKADLADDALNKLERISANAKLQTDLIGDLLDLSKIRTRPGRKDKIDLAQLIEELRQGLDYDLERSHIELQVEGELPLIYAERNRMRQVFQNLIDNAIKYMLDAKTRQVRVRSWRDETLLWFEVTDTGCGIAQQDIHLVFQVFQRSTHSGSHTVQGRGVGLASVKSIIESYGGTIDVKSTLGQGSTFRFSLDAHKVGMPATTMAPAQS